MEGRKALRHRVFMYMDCKCQHVCGPCVILLLCFTSLVRLFLFFPHGSELNTLTCLWVSLFHIVMLYLILCSSHVAGMIGLINKTKGLRFCNVSGFLELYNDPQVRLTAINSQSFHSKYPWPLIDYCWLSFWLCKKNFYHGRETSRFLLTGSWQGWLKCWVNYQSKYKKWRLLEPSYCFILSLQMPV